MEDFVVSARKYRPISFDDVVGQTHITSTLRNALKSKKIPHALLFCGPRGVGKTTCARILAKSLNCMNPSAEMEPCGTCESCVGFQTSHSFNIHELDAASNNSVDDIRDLINQVRMAPQVGSYAVYIIDEVHMLSQQAFNAFLKTLEEPPKHAIFILATTEKHKILPTILSRCQIFDFKRITVDDITGHLARIAVKENIEAEEKGLHVIAQKADGALRDALSIFDRIVTFSGTSFGYQQVIENLNVLDYDYHFKMVDMARDAQRTDLLLLVNEVLNLGFDGGHLLAGLAEHIRNLLVVDRPETAKLLEATDEVKERYVAQSATIGLDKKVAMLEHIAQSEGQYRNANNKRLHLELSMLLLVRLLNPDPGSGPEGAKSQGTQPPKSSEDSRPANSSSGAPQALSQEKEIAKADRFAAPSAEPQELVKEHEAKAEEKAPPTIEQSKAPPPDAGDQETRDKPRRRQAVSRGLSIKGIQEQKAAGDINWEPKAKEPFTKEALEAAVQDFCSGLSERPMLQTLLSQCLLEQASETEFLVVLHYGGQEQSFDEVRQELLAHVREKLSNDFIEFKTEVRVQENSAKPYTNQEKFEEMCRKNPALMELKTKLGLDFK